MMSLIPKQVTARLSKLLQGVDEGLQAESHQVSKAMALTPAFDQGYVGSPLLRALICRIGSDVSATFDIPFVELGNGGCEAQITYQGIERRFRFRKATFDGDGFLNIKVSSDSLLTDRAQGANRTLFEQNDEGPVATLEQWVLAYVLNPITRTLSEVYAAFPIGLLNHSKPFRLAFGDVVAIPLTVPTPPDFPGDRQDLDLGDDQGQEEEGHGEAA